MTTTSRKPLHRFLTFAQKLETQHILITNSNNQRMLENEGICQACRELDIPIIIDKGHGIGIIQAIYGHELPDIDEVGFYLVSALELEQTPKSIFEFRKRTKRAKKGN